MCRYALIVQGYGPNMAFPPASMTLDGPGNVINYISNGINNLPMVIHVQDQAGNAIRSGTNSCC